MPDLLFSRASRITVGTVQIASIGQQLGLACWFQVRRSLKPNEPNTADLKIRNLSPSSRKSLEQHSQQVSVQGNQAIAVNAGGTTVIPVKIEAGYVNTMGTIFLGEMRSAQTVRDGNDFVTELQTGDGDAASTIARINQCLGATNAYNVVQTLLSAAKLGTGNLATVQGILSGAKLFRQGVMLRGNPVDILTDLARSVGLEFTIQKGAALFLSLGQPTTGNAYSLSSSTGLIGEPSVDTKGVLTCETLMLQGLKPGDPISMNSLFVQGLFRITSIQTVGDTHGADWSHRIEGKRYGKAA